MEEIEREFYVIEMQLKLKGTYLRQVQINPGEKPYKCRTKTLSFCPSSITVFSTNQPRFL
jgi:hypothetical protein